MKLARKLEAQLNGRVGDVWVKSPTDLAFVRSTKILINFLSIFRLKSSARKVNTPTDKSKIYIINSALQNLRINLVDKDLLCQHMGQKQIK